MFTLLKIGLTPLVSLHNLLIVVAIAMFRVTVPGAILGWLLTLPLGFLLDPVFDMVGRALLLDATGLTPLWTTVTNTRILSLANLGNTVVLGSLVSWAVLAVPFFVAVRTGVVQYRRHVYSKVAQWRVFKVMKASKAYNVYRMFRP